ncbi:hypothetical protein [Chryseobacterium sp. ERMR1:04]|uniref:hypothetical protein n=1 Tax=Chryseobacterium sp. ERMR1:04 TaxID=1705393 RepID=UPI0006C8CBFC|nr:hypothetical protein [Chryseobacterium sp. ERMR1:04]KPH12293.1 hypothetical protein AMQ68_15235 [Chryseobacterium sp. ERMR1:04]
MKKLLFLSTLSVFALSCSDKLSESKVKKVVNKCLEKNPVEGRGYVRTGKVSFLVSGDIKEYKELEKKGLLKMESIEEKKGFFTNEYELVALTDKSKPYVIDTKDVDGDEKGNYVKLYTNKIDKVGSIQEIPSMNMAEVSVTFKKDDKTPFYDVLETDKTDFYTKKIMFKKTENNGWVYCDE